MPLTSAMAASFVAQNGADENNQAVHHFQWMGTSDPDRVTMLLAWQPWIQQTTFNGRTVLYYLDVLSLAAEFMTGWDNGVAAMPVMLHLPAPAALVEVIYVCSAGIPKATATKATVAVQAAAARARYTSAQTTASRLIATDMVKKTDTGGALCPWQRRVTYANLALTEGGPIALGWMASRGEFLRFCRDSNLLEALRYAAERNGACPMRSGMAPHPAPRPNPLPPDTVDPEISAYATCQAMSEIYFNCTPFLRHAFLTIAQKTAACAAEIDSIVNPVDGDTHELRRRVRGVVAETAPRARTQNLGARGARAARAPPHDAAVLRAGRRGDAADPGHHRRRLPRPADLRARQQGRRHEILHPQLPQLPLQRALRR